VAVGVTGQEAVSTLGRIGNAPLPSLGVQEVFGTVERIEDMDGVSVSGPSSRIDAE
jgi:hypothetical protein